MRLFSWLYDRVVSRSRHLHAPRYPGAPRIDEAACAAMPPDVMPASMRMTQQVRDWRSGLLATATALAGGRAGYFVAVVVPVPLLH
jgi:membrane protein YqaA with SNARE-associated domain